MPSKVYARHIIFLIKATLEQVSSCYVGISYRSTVYHFCC